LDYEKMRRMKDEFFLAARARPATAQHYVAWLEGYLDAGGKVDSYVGDKFYGSEFVTISQDCNLPPLESHYGVNVLVPPGVTVDTSGPGDCTAYFFDTPSKHPAGKVRVWKEMLPSLIEDGYGLSQLVPASQVSNMMRDRILKDVAEMERRNDYYETFSHAANFDTIKERQKKLASLDGTDMLRDILGLPAGAPIDPATRGAIHSEMNEAARVLAVLHYKHDPVNETPVAVFRRKTAKAAPPVPAADAAVALSGQIEVGPPLTFKKRRTKPKSGNKHG
jgi:hypothetical protein